MGGLYTSDSIKAALDFPYDEYKGELGELTHVAMVQTLQQEGRLQPGCRKPKRA